MPSDPRDNIAPPEGTKVKKYYVIGDIVCYIPEGLLLTVQSTKALGHTEWIWGTIDASTTSTMFYDVTVQVFGINDRSPPLKMGTRAASRSKRSMSELLSNCPRRGFP
jgi:hypothetical protein